jgi:hypothetical protein
MGNSKLANGCQHPSATPTARSCPEKGILAYVPGDIISEAGKQLPAPDPFGPEHSEVEIDARHAGRVRIFFELGKVRHHKHSHWYWKAYRAEPVHGDWDSDASQT